MLVSSWKASVSGPDSAKSQTYNMYFLFHFLPRCAATFDLLILQLQDLTVHTQ